MAPPSLRMAIMVIMVCPVATAQAEMPDITTICAAALLWAQAPWRRVSHTRWAPVGECDLTEWRGKEVDVFRWTSHVLKRLLSYLHASSTVAGYAASVAELSRNAKYADVIAGVDSVLIVIETSGVWGEQALILVKDVGRRIAEVSEEPRCIKFLGQRLSVAIERGYGDCIYRYFAFSGRWQLEAGTAELDNNYNYIDMFEGNLLWYKKAIVVIVIIIIISIIIIIFCSAFTISKAFGNEVPRVNNKIIIIRLTPRL